MTGKVAALKADGFSSAVVEAGRRMMGKESSPVSSSGGSETKKAAPKLRIKLRLKTGASSDEDGAKKRLATNSSKGGGKSSKSAKGSSSSSPLASRVVVGHVDGGSQKEG